MTDEEVMGYLTERQVVGGTLWAECRGESIGGIVGVGSVIRTRAKVRQQTMKAVCLAPAQFSCWRPVGGAMNAKNYRMLMDAMRLLPDVRDPVLKECLWIAEGLGSGVLLDSVQGADHYLTTALYDSDGCPAWAKTMTRVAVVDHHTFLRSY